MGRPKASVRARLQRYQTIHIQLGYRTIFATINAAFRHDSLTDDRLAMRCAVFLVELLSIDLFNYRAVNEHADNFEGHLYRGMHVSLAQFEMFERLAEDPLPERYLAILLAMASASRKMENALAFALEESRRTPEEALLVWDISVSSPDPDLLDAYRVQFPASIVTSLCAVPIETLSDYEDEQEVVLRGAHFQILRMVELGAGLGRRAGLIEAVMLNSNRDHLTAIASNTGDDQRAREFFRRLIFASRSEICVRTAAQCGLDADAAWYLSEARRNRQEIDTLAY